MPVAGPFTLASRQQLRHLFDCSISALQLPPSTEIMPTYEYECQACGHQFEAVQSMNDPRLTDCPLPGCKGAVHRKIGRGAGIIFKGSGFYQTDYRSDSYKAAAKKDSESSSGSGSAAPKESPAPASSTSSAPASAPASPPSTGSAA